MLEKIKQHKGDILFAAIITSGIAVVSGVTYVITKSALDAHYLDVIHEMNVVAQKAGVMDALLEVQNNL